MIGVFVASGVYSVVLLGTGAYLGHLVTRLLPTANGRKRSSRRLRSQHSEKLATYRADSLRLAKQTHELQALASVHQPAISPALMQAIEQLVSATANLSHKVTRLEASFRGQSALEDRPDSRDVNCQQRTSRSTKTPQAVRTDCRGIQDREPANSIKPAQATESYALSNDEIRNLSKQGTNVDGLVNEPTVRHQYHCEQYLAPWSPGQSLPHPHEFKLVKCRDISAGGISFFLNERPNFDYFVIGVGKGERLLVMIGKVMHSRAVYMYSEVGYLTGAKFIKRINDLPFDWALPCAADEVVAAKTSDE